MTLTGEESPIVLPDDPIFGPDVQVDYPGYRSTRLRAPKRPLASLPEELHDLAGPVFGEDAVARARPRPDAAARRRAARRADHRHGPRARRGRAGRFRGALVEVWQANAAGRYHHDVDQHPAPLDPNFSGAGRCLTDADGRYRFVTVKPGAYPWGNHENAWRPAHIHFSIFGRLFTQRLVTQMYFPGDPLFAYDPIFNSVRDPRSRELLVARVRPRHDAAGMGARLPVGHRARPRPGGDAVGGAGVTRSATPSQTVGPYYAIGLCRVPENELVEPGEPRRAAADRARARRRRGAGARRARGGVRGRRRPPLGTKRHRRRRAFLVRRVEAGVVDGEAPHLDGLRLRARPARAPADCASTSRTRWRQTRAIPC